MIIDDLKSKLVEYYKSRDTVHLDVLRYFLSQVKNREIELRTSGGELNDEEAFKILRRLVKQRIESIGLYEKGGRKDLVEKETAELSVLKEFASLFPFELNLPAK